MQTNKVIYVSGYRNYEIGVFKDKDPKIEVIKNVLKSELQNFIEEGTEWILISGNLGVELWTAEVVAELKTDYPEVKLGIIYPFAEFGAQWNEQNLAKKALAEQVADYCASVSKHPYQTPQQLKNHTNFLLEHTDGALLIYDEEYEGKPTFFFRDATNYLEQNEYDLRLISMDDLQNSIE
ncbi:MAG: DUF1273 domain-containing protein [Enterococcus sp.]